MTAKARAREAPEARAIPVATSATAQSAKRSTAESAAASGGAARGTMAARLEGRSRGRSSGGRGARARTAGIARSPASQNRQHAVCGDRVRLLEPRPRAGDTEAREEEQGGAGSEERRRERRPRPAGDVAELARGRDRLLALELRLLECLGAAHATTRGGLVVEPGESHRREHERRRRREAERGESAAPLGRLRNTAARCGKCARDDGSVLQELGRGHEGGARGPLRSRRGAYFTRPWPTVK